VQRRRDLLSQLFEGELGVIALLGNRLVHPGQYRLRGTPPASESRGRPKGLRYSRGNLRLASGTRDTSLH
jgi:hypothetical protein